MAIQEQTVKQSAPFFCAKFYSLEKLSSAKDEWRVVISAKYSNHLYLSEVSISV